MDARRFWDIFFSICCLIICTNISTLGIKQGIIRSIAYSRSRGDNQKVTALCYAAVFLSIATSLIAGIIIFLLSEVIAQTLFHEPTLVAPLQIFSMAIPFFTLIDILVSIFRGFDQVKQTVYFQYILANILFPLFLLVVIVLNLSFIYVFYAYVASLVVTCIIFIIYSLKKLPLWVIRSAKPISNNVSKELLIFSFPLLVSTLVTMTINWSDTLILGGLKTSVDVGLYNAARPLALLISFLLNALLLIYMPIISGLYAKGRIHEMKQNYAILTK